MYLDFQGRRTLYRAKIFYDNVGSPRAHGNEMCRHTGQIETNTSGEIMYVCVRYRNSFKHKKNIMHVHVIS